MFLQHDYGTTGQIQRNIEAIDMLQSALHAVDHSIVMIVGDVNINLSQELPTSWHRAYPCNAYS